MPVSKNPGLSRGHIGLDEENRGDTLFHMDVLDIPHAPNGAWSFLRLFPLMWLPFIASSEMSRVKNAFFSTHTQWCFSCGQPHDYHPPKPRPRTVVGRTKPPPNATHRRAALRQGR